MSQIKRLQTIDADTLQSTAYEPVSFVVDDLLSQGLHLLAGAPKIGKSWLTLWLCLCAAQGKPLWTFATRPCEVLLQMVGETGTIMMLTQSWKNLDPESGVHWQEPQEWLQLIRDNWPAYDKRITPANTMGAVAEMFRTWPGTFRSNHPARSVAANGQHAQFLTENHDLSNIFGDGSPIARLYDLDGYVLLVGVGYDKNTSLHLADARAQYPGKQDCVEHSAIVENGRRIWKEYRTLFVDGEDFDEIGAAFERECSVRTAPLGNGIIRFMRQRELVDFAVGWIERHRGRLE